MARRREVYLGMRSPNRAVLLSRSVSSGYEIQEIGPEMGAMGVGDRPGWWREGDGGVECWDDVEAGDSGTFSC